MHRLSIIENAKNTRFAIDGVIWLLTSVRGFHIRHCRSHDYYIVIHIYCIYIYIRYIYIYIHIILSMSVIVI